MTDHLTTDDLRKLQEIVADERYSAEFVGITLRNNPTILQRLIDTQEALAEMVASCTSMPVSLNDGCGTSIVTAPTWDALNRATQVLTPTQTKGSSNG